MSVIFILAAQAREIVRLVWQRPVPDRVVEGGNGSGLAFHGDVIGDKIILAMPGEGAADHTSGAGLLNDET